MIKNDKELIELGRTYILDIVKKYVHLQRRGKNHIGLCPFHNEKSPSFTVNEDKGYYKCFGCGQGGDGINFLMERENMTFPEALEEIGSIANIKVDYINSIDRTEYLDAQKREQDRREAQSAQLAQVFNMYYYRGLPFSEIRWASNLPLKKIDYQVNIDGRWFSLSTIKAFQLSYASESLFITQNIESDKLDRTILLEVGLIKENDKGTYDTFRKRLLFPIHDHLNKLVGFSGRKPRSDENEKNPKYINSSESLIYKKRELLYGLNVNRKGIQDADYAILMEGYTDVISCYENGIQNAVATAGTAFTPAQAKLLARYTKKLLILRDGDTAGEEAARKDVAVAVAAGLQVSVCLLPDGDDPDSMARRVGYKGVMDHIEANKKDGIIWLSMLGWEGGDVYKHEECMQLAASLIANIDSEIVQNDYLNKLCSKERMGDVKKILKDIINKIKDNKQKRGDIKLSPQQQFDAINYGIYEAHSKYWICTNVKEGSGSEISNFIIKPVMLIRARDEQRRLIEIINEHNQRHLLEIQTNVFASFEQFSSYIEGVGNFLYNEWAKKAHHIKIKRKVYSITPTCYPIYTMGYHKEGFFTWGNGIVTPKGKWKPVDEYGLVEYEDTKYFLKAHSKIDVSIKSDDVENTMEDQINFYFNNSGKPPSLKEITTLMVKIHGPNAMVAIAWMFTALFRDIIYGRLDFFPHLNHFGKPSSGKSFLAWSLSYFFGSKPKAPFHLLHGTKAAFFRTLSWVRNGLAWFDEYKDNIDVDKVESLKAAYDGAGREKAKDAYGHNITRTPVNSACLITGQEQPLQDPALYTRCITLSFPEKTLTQEQIDNANKLKDIQKTGLLTQLTSRILMHRNYIDENFVDEYDAIRSLLRKQMLADQVDINDRIVQNYAIILTIFGMLSSKEEIGFSYEQLLEFAYDNMLTQLDSMQSQDEVGTFWTIIDFLIADYKLAHSKDIIVAMSRSEKVQDQSDRSNRKDTELITWKEPQKLVYVNFTRTHPLYQEQMQKSKKNDGLAVGAMKYYLKGTDAYVGEKRAKKFDGKTKPCMIFLADKLPVDFQLTSVATGVSLPGEDKELHLFS